MPNMQNGNLILLGDYNDDVDQTISCSYNYFILWSYVNDATNYNVVTKSLGERI
jgi:hypothetical protein